MVLEALTYVIVALVIAGIFFLYNSFVIREISYYLKFNDHSFHNSMLLALYITLIFVLKMYIGQIIVLNLLLIIAFFAGFYVLAKREYFVDTKQALYMIGLWVVAFILLAAILSGLLLSVV